MSEDRRGPGPEPKSGLRLPLLFNLFLVTATVTVLLLAFGRAENRARAAVSFESRFITTEWHLLSELKERTDTLLEAKDREIVLLRRLYAELLRNGAPLRERRTVSSQLERAYLEREAIMQTRLAPPESRNGSAATLEDWEPPTAGPAGRSDEAPIAQRLEMELPEASLIDPETEEVAIWYRRVVEALLVRDSATAEEELRRALGSDTALPAEDRSRLTALIAARREEEELASLFGALEEALGEADAARAELETELTQARERGFAAGQLSGRIRALENALLLLDYYAGDPLEIPREERGRLITLWEEERLFREIVLGAQQIASAGIADGRDDLPSPLLLGVVSTVDGESVGAESLTELAVELGEAVEIRTQSESPPGELVAVATVIGRAGSFVTLRVDEIVLRDPRRNDLVYIYGEAR